MVAEEKMKVIGFNGSARKNGNTSVIIQKVFDVLQSEGIETELIHLGPKSVNGCLACWKCFKNQNGKCIQTKDKLNVWVEKMNESDGIILGSPVYVAELTAQLKAFIDRTCLVAMANGNMFKRKVGAGVVVARRAGTVSTFHSINSWFTIAEMVVVGSTYWNNVFGMEPGEVEKDDEGLMTMRNLGRNMAWLLKSIEAARGMVNEPVTTRAAQTNFIR